jgi:anhydro-N-acetylmuramic acid kinase
VDVVIAIGVMSGTSADGIDAVAIDLQSAARRHTPRVIGHVHRAYPAKVRDDLLRHGDLTTKRLAELHYQLARLYAGAVRALPGFRRATVCGLHGQTVWHAPPPSRAACTLQIGSSAVLAEELGIPVVGDLRGADVAAGGQGAPIVPFAHWFFTPPASCPRLVVNFGGICNITYVTKRVEDVRAYDVWPGMMLSDAYAMHTTGGRMTFDRDGKLSRGGRVIETLVAEIAAHPFVRRRPPKSTGREDFGRHFFEPIFRRYRRAPSADVARSLLAASAQILREAAERDRDVGTRVRDIVLSGGGGRNPTLVEEVRARFPGVVVRVADDGVFAPELHEPAAMALIAARTQRGLPSSLPAVTGASRAMILGHVHPATRPAAKGHRRNGPRSVSR